MRKQNKIKELEVSDFKINIIVPNSHWSFVTKGMNEGAGTDEGHFNETLDIDDVSFSQVYYFAKKNLLDCKVYGGFFAWSWSGSECKNNTTLSIKSFDDSKIVLNEDNIVTKGASSGLASQNSNVSATITLEKNDDDSVKITVTPHSYSGSWGTTSWAGAFGAISYITLKGEND